ncbi:MAG: GPW/gp25 family protein [Oscillospiraceae bacterium]|jgi:phage baseplate assembly protein W|nr:GPW/gp25 family protein [Oscillospiraceae bacterium]
MSIIEGWKFPININSKTGKIETVCDNAAIKQSVEMILKTQIMERKVVPNYGSELRSYVFTVIDANSVSSFKKAIKYAIENWEKHVQTIKVSTRATSGPVSRMQAEIEYTTDINPTPETITKEINMSGVN